MEMEPVCCDICGSDGYKLLKMVRSLYSDDWFSLVKCRDCGLVYVNPRQAKDEKMRTLSGIKTSAIFAEKGENNLETYKDAIRDISKYVNGRRILDIGCSTGDLLFCAKEQGWDTFGVEINKDSARLGSEKFGIPIFAGDIFEANLPSDSFDAVTMLNTIEHLYNPRETLEEVKKVLKKDGLLYLTTPNLNNYAVRTVQLLGFLNKDIDRIDPTGHPYIFTPKTLTALLRKTGFKIIGVKAGVQGSFMKRRKMACIVKPFLMLTEMLDIGSTITVIAK